MQKYLVNNTDELPTKEYQCLQNLLAVGPEIVLVAGKQTFNTTPCHSPALKGIPLSLSLSLRTEVVK